MAQKAILNFIRWVEIKNFSTICAIFSIALLFLTTLLLILRLKFLSEQIAKLVYFILILAVKT